MSGAFAKLHPKIQEAIWRQGWGELRPLQTDAIHAVSDTEDHLILAAATASGKTEAAFLPILSQLAAEESPGSIQALYISPLKALINDQFRRLETLCELADLPVHRWHGDVSATEKQRLRKEPGGVLLITPESLESQFINYHRQLPRLYAQLRFIVIDELHAFLENVRGIHLRSLLARLGHVCGVQARRLGLSATIGDFRPAQAFLAQDQPQRVQVLEDGSQQKELRVGLKAYLEPPPAGLQMRADLAQRGEAKTGLRGIADDLADRFRKGSNLVFCNSRRQTELIADHLHEICREEHWVRDPFLLHHGSLSRELREDAERALKSGEPVTAICTSTLEMGIDLGAVEAVAQVEPTWSVASLAQRLGRSGRREGEPQRLRLYTLDEAAHAKSSLEDQLFPELVRGIALVELYRARRLEPPEAERYHYSTCVHQILSLCRQTGGLQAAPLFDQLCRRGAFRKVDEKRFATLLRGLATAELLEQVPTGELILAPAAERIVESWEFYAAFASTVEYRIEHAGNAIGVMPRDSIPAVGEFLLLAGRRWRVELIDEASKSVEVSTARGWTQPRFSGGGGGIHALVMQEMRRVLAGSGPVPYLNPDATELLQMARKTFRDCGLTESDLVGGGSEVRWFPWCGTRIMSTLVHCAAELDVEVRSEDISLSYPGLEKAGLLEHLRTVAEDETIAERLKLGPAVLQQDKFDEYVPEVLLREAYLAENLDFPGMRKLIAAVLAPD